MQQPTSVCQIRWLNPAHTAGRQLQQHYSVDTNSSTNGSSHGSSVASERSAVYCARQLLRRYSQLAGVGALLVAQRHYTDWSSEASGGSEAGDVEEGASSCSTCGSDSARSWLYVAPPPQPQTQAALPRTSPTNWQQCRSTPARNGASPLVGKPAATQSRPTRAGHCGDMLTHSAKLVASLHAGGRHWQPASPPPADAKTSMRIMLSLGHGHGAKMRSRSCARVH